jgi:hypothetical protein
MTGKEKEALEFKTSADFPVITFVKARKSYYMSVMYQILARPIYSKYR